MGILRRIAVMAAAMACVLASASAARAQHCWPAMVGLVMRDSAGQVIALEALDSVEYAPLPSDTADFRVGTWHFGPTAARGLAGDGAAVPALTWSGQGSCRVDIDTVVLWRGGREMRLRLGVHVDTDADPGPSVYLIDLPPLQSGTFDLGWDDPPGGGDNTPAILPASRWRRVEGGS